LGGFIPKDDAVMPIPTSRRQKIRVRRGGAYRA
jgi:hypothetical protein